MPALALVIDDDRALVDLIAHELTRAGYETRAYTDPARALADLDAIRPAVVLCDLRMPRMDGLSACREVRARRPGVPVVLMTGFGDVDAAVRALRGGAFDFLSKPVSRAELLAAIRRAAPIGSADARIVGESEPMRRLVDRVAKVARSDLPILITGETGTGKELVARAIHDGSLRADKPFVAINCAAVAEGLLDSELFGHVRGAFTDARTDRVGLFREAEGGTLFLDEIGDMPPAVQARLLRALQERRIRPVGSDVEVAVDVRVVAATHRSLEADVASGRFRADLFYRLEGVSLSVPPLRDRGEDILLLARTFLARAGGSRVLAPAVEEALVAWGWPGNVRELERAMQHAALLAEGPVIELSDLPGRIVGGVVDGPSNTPSLGDLERDHVLRTVARVGSRTEAARVLGIDRKTLYRKLRDWGVAA